ncbi:MAG: IS3 family transposase [Actinobacteria bacterium]|nr:IS3 family transposase [Actinomycetota bacterium]
MTATLDGLVDEFAPKVGRARACTAFAVNPRSHRHRRQRDDGRLVLAPPATPGPRRRHPAALGDDEKDLIVATLCEERFCDLAPAQVYSTLLDEGVYLCSERQMYRVLAERGLVRERRRGGHQRAGSFGVPRLEADRPNKVWTWDITALRGPTKGVRYYLYTIIDIFSRKVVGWSIHAAESEAHACRLIREACRRHGVDRDQLVIHADRGSPMIAGTVAELLNELGVAKSHSRPRVSNDNPFIESHFKTLKYRPDYPDRFDSINHARSWCRRFVHWYNEVHYHSGIGYLRPADLHDGNHTAIVEHRQTTLDAAAAAHPERFTKRPTPAKIPTKAWINKPTIQSA